MSLQIQPHWGNGIAIAVIKVTARGAKRSAKRGIRSKRTNAVRKEAGNGANANKEPTGNGASVRIDADTKRFEQRPTQDAAGLKLRRFLVAIS